MENAVNQNPLKDARAIPPRPAKDYDAERQKPPATARRERSPRLSDPKGIPTIGMGHALITKDETAITPCANGKISTRI
jgi:hypothetical protein